MITHLEQPTSTINENLRLMTSTLVSSSISLSIPKPILQLDTTLLDTRISGMTLNLSDPNRLPTSSTDHMC